MNNYGFEVDSLEKRLSCDELTTTTNGCHNLRDDIIAKILAKNDRLNFPEENSSNYENVYSKNSSSILHNEETTSSFTFEFIRNYFCNSDREMDVECKIESDRPKLEDNTEDCHKRTNRKNKISNIVTNLKRKSSGVMYRNFCMFSVCLAFGFGLLLGVLVPLFYLSKLSENSTTNSSKYQSLIFNSSSVGSLEFAAAFTYDDLKKEDELNRFENAPKRVFLKSNIKKVKVDTPVDISVSNVGSQLKLETLKMKKVNKVKLNRPKNFRSVSFMRDGDEMINTGFEQKQSLLHYGVVNLSDTDAAIDVKMPLDLVDAKKESILRNQRIEDVENDDDTIVYGNIYWGAKVEKALPSGFGSHSNDQWVNYVKTSAAVKMEVGCGRMQNRLVTFLDGRQACVRYRQNTDQIQGELFSFYLAQVLRLPNLAPSLISLVNLTDVLWQNVASDIGSAQWNSNRPVVMTKYIPNLESAHIPSVFKKTERHLNKFDISNIVEKGSGNDDDTDNKSGDFLLKKLAESVIVGKNDDLEINEDETNTIDEKTQHLLDVEPSKDNTSGIAFVRASIGDDLLDKFVELAQWSDLIIFDYLTANLDRIVNNLYNFQWNANIMDAPAHNLARKVDSDLLLFLDNESGLLHGYRLLGKYEVYHTLLLDNLCVFRKSTADAIKSLSASGDVGNILNGMFKDKNGAAILDVLPPLPEKSIKILNERLARVESQIKRCEEQFAR